jgi:hypothetical protein
LFFSTEVPLSRRKFSITSDTKGLSKITIPQKLIKPKPVSQANKKDQLSPHEKITVAPLAGLLTYSGNGWPSP